MDKKFIFYMDDFGTRTICKGSTDSSSPPHEFLFSLGGVIVASEDVEDLSMKVLDFCNQWKVPALHGNAIRSRKGKFNQISKNEETWKRFLTELETLVLDERLIVHACVICRPGYRDRYLMKYPDSTRWEMSRTAYDISVERAAKYASHLERKLDVVFEKAGKKEDQLLMRYFEDLKSGGTDFSTTNAGKYSPLSKSDFESVLNVTWCDGKSNPLLQLADLMVHPVSQIACGKGNRAYEQLCANKMLIDCKHPDKTIGVKYSCFDGDYQVLVP